MSGFEKRFSGIQRLYGAEGLRRLRDSSVCVVGLGGVGSWAVEALARSGIGHISLVDLDDVCISNVNRQLHAVDGELGKPKVEVLARRVRAINPECQVEAVQSFFTSSTAETILAPNYDFVLDAIDSPSKKALLIALCCSRKTPVITTGGAAGRRDPTAIRVMDLAQTSGDRLLLYLRSLLRTRHGFPRNTKEPFNVECVCSIEAPVYPQQDGSVCSQRPAGGDLRLDCHSGFGSATFVTGAFGFAAASRMVGQLVKTVQPPVPTAKDAFALASDA